jgi:hypothetical protein
MATRLMTSAAAALGLLMLVGGPAEAKARVRRAPPVEPCDDACLRGFVDGYLDALAAHDPSKLPTTATVKFTENTRPLKLGDGLWGTITKVGGYRHYFTDPSTGEVGFFGNLEEQGTPALFVLRLKVVQKKINEVETVVVRKQDMGAFLNTDRTLKPIWQEEAPADQRLPRAKLVSISNSYFDALEMSDGDVAPFDDDCVRVENGVQTVNNKAAAGQANDVAKGFNPGAMTCRDQINTHLFSYISRIQPRRYVVVDEPHQSVLSIVMFHHNGRITQVDVPGQGTQKMTAAALRPFDVVIGEAFRIRDGKIREVEAVMTSLPYGSDTGWDK